MHGHVVRYYYFVLVFNIHYTFFPLLPPSTSKCKLRGRRRKQWKKCVMDIISDMKLTVSSLDSKEALTNIDKVYMDYVTSNLHAGMCEKNRLRVYRELKEVFECKKYLYGVPDMGSKLLFRFRSGTHGIMRS